MLPLYPKAQTGLCIAVCFSESQKFLLIVTYLECIDPISKLKLSLIDCFVKSVGLRLFFCLMRGNVSNEIYFFFGFVNCIQSPFPQLSFKNSYLKINRKFLDL